MHSVALEELVARASGDPAGLARLAVIFANMGKDELAQKIALQALKSAPADGAARPQASSVLSKYVPKWHFAILRDQARHDAYEAALRRAATPDMHVLEVGTGSGILAMMAARAGARKVTTCEEVPVVAETAREIVARNGYADRVTVVSKRSDQLDLAADLGERADLFVSELVDNKILGENVLDVVEHTARDLLKPGAKIIPARGTIRVALARDDRLGIQPLGEVAGFDLSPFNRLASGRYTMPCGDPQLSLLSPPADLFAFDFQSGGPFPDRKTTTALTSTGGRATGIAQWFALQMDEIGWYENRPGPGATSSWAVVIWPFASPRELAAGATVDVFASHTRRDLQIWTDPGATAVEGDPA